MEKIFLKVKNLEIGGEVVEFIWQALEKENTQGECSGMYPKNITTEFS